MVICTNCLIMAEKPDEIKHSFEVTNCVGWLPLHIYLRRQRERLERQEKKTKLLMIHAKRFFQEVMQVKGPPSEDVFRF